MSRLFFVAGTDTDVGKTLVSCALLHAAANRGLETAAIKPVAAGCEQTSNGLQNDDALQLQAAATIPLPYQRVNPVALEPAIAPHIAAAAAGQRLNTSRLAGFCRGISLAGAGFSLIEGAGGWLAPLNERETFADLARELQTPVILVVAMRLGCINHALLTARSIVYDGLPLAGWVANRIRPDMACYEENLATLQQRLPCPLLGEIPWLETPDSETAATYLNVQPLIA